MSKRILFIVEGRKTEPTFLKRLLSGLGVTDEHQIFVFGTNIHVLFEKVFGTDDSEDINLLGALREGESEKERVILSGDYSDVYLVFDAEFQDPRFDYENLKTMLEYFDNSTENGKLYLNYPMMESYLHLKKLNDPEYLTRTVYSSDIKSYKRTARAECCKELSNAGCYTRDLILVIVHHNYLKARLLLGAGIEHSEDICPVSDSGYLLFIKQWETLREEDRIYVLNTSVFLALEHDPRIMFDIHNSTFPTTDPTEKMGQTEG